MVVENHESISACRLTTTDTQKRFGFARGRKCYWGFLVAPSNDLLTLLLTPQIRGNG